MRERDCYRVLKLQPDASLSEIQSSYRRLVKLYHPDLTGRPRDGMKLAQVVDAFRTLQQAKPKDRATGPREGSPTTTRHTGSGAGLSLSDLGRLVTGGGTPSTRAFAVLRLANSGRRSVYSWIRPALFDESPTVVEAAVDAVGSLGILQAGGELGAVFARGSGGMKLRVLDAVRQMSDLRPFRSIIIAGMQSDDADVRRLGLELFRRLKLRKTQ